MLLKALKNLNYSSTVLTLKLPTIRYTKKLLKTYTKQKKMSQLKNYYQNQKSKSKFKKQSKKSQLILKMTSSNLRRELGVVLGRNPLHPEYYFVFVKSGVIEEWHEKNIYNI